MNRVPEPDLHLVADDDAEQQILAGQSLHLGNRERGRDIDAGVVRPAHRHIVIVVEIAQRHRIQERSLIARDFPPQSDRRRLRIAALKRHDLFGHPDRGRTSIAAQEATDAVEQCALRRCDDVRRQLFVAKIDDPSRDVLDDGRACLAPKRRRRKNGGAGERSRFQNVTARNRIRRHTPGTAS